MPLPITLNVKRFNPDSDQDSYIQEYQLDVAESDTVLDSLIHIREEIDGTLTFRCSCRSAICGSCAMRIDGKAGLACNTKISDLVSGDKTSITVEPAGNMPVIKDLVVEFEVFWKKIRQVSPWLKHFAMPPKGEHIVPNESMLHLAGVMNCIMCGACVSDCTSLEVNSEFIGPAALAKSYRFLADPRDEANENRLIELSQPGGIWDCTRCMQCVEVCPKEVDPMGRIMSSKELAIEMGITANTGARHANVFASSVHHSGWLDELKLPLLTHGIFNFKEMFKLAFLGLRAFKVGKVPPVIHKKRPNVAKIRQIFEKVGHK